MTPRVLIPGAHQTGEAMRLQPWGEAKLDACTEWDADWPADDDGDWSGCARDGEEG